MRVAVLCGGVGGSRFVSAMCQVLKPRDVTAIVNTGDDILMHGLHLSPDVDIVTYTLAGLVNEKTGWGRAQDSFVAMEALGRLQPGNWFALGDKDLGVHLYRTGRLAAGHSLTAISAEVAAAMGVEAQILPMCDEAVPTRVVTERGDVHFQEFLVRDGCAGTIRAIYSQNMENAKLTTPVQKALRDCELILLAPSNPFVSIGTILQVPGLRRALLENPCPKIGVSPLLGGKVIKGPAAKMLADLGHPVSALGVAAQYRGLLDAFVMDGQDRALDAPVQALGMRAVFADTMLDTKERRSALTRRILQLAEELARER
ncbi:2-phospho-L-lactate transferase [Clostridia bacterium OttesenSCG-928-O13]|nr:2-phospho-L-lactate transferase [Clostridia bacterium OttesenSCG-928-O13]